MARVELHRQQLLAVGQGGDDGAAPMIGPSRSASAIGVAALDRAERGLVRLPRALAADDLDRAAAARAGRSSMNSRAANRGADQRHALRGELGLGLGRHHARAEVGRRPRVPSTAR